MLRVGLTGGLACGKSFIGQELERLGCHVIHADVLGHEVLAPGGEAYARVLQRFGASMVNPDGAIDRPRLAELVFKHPDELAALNAIVHPAVRQREEKIMDDIARADPQAIAVVEAAILIEAGAFERFDSLIVAYCPEQLQLERALARDPAMSEHDIMARLRRQMPVEEKRKFAHFVIDTSGEKEETLRQTREIYTRLRQLAK